jgi:hypothetical protein
LNLPKIDVTTGTAPWSRRTILSLWIPNLLHLVKISLDFLMNNLYKFPSHYDRSRDRIVDIVSGYGLDDGGVGVRALVGSRTFSLLHVVQIGSEAHPASFPMVTGGKAVGA